MSTHFTACTLRMSGGEPDSLCEMTCCQVIHLAEHKYANDNHCLLDTNKTQAPGPIVNSIALWSL